jgi:hypothetical protein
MKHLICDKSVALVGRAASILEHGDGAKIDSMDVVVRVNWLLPHNLPKEKVGSRTDLLIHAEPAVEVPKRARKIGVTTWMKDVSIRWELIENGVITKEFNPTTGITAIDMLFKAGALKVYMTGFDFYQSGLATKTIGPKFHPIGASKAATTMTKENWESDPKWNTTNYPKETKHKASKGIARHSTETDKIVLAYFKKMYGEKLIFDAHLSKVFNDFI